MRIAEVRTTPLGGMGCSSNPNERCGNGLEKIYPTTAVRYGYMKHIGEFTYKPGTVFTCGGKVIIQTKRGIEVGQQVSLTCTGCSKSVSRDDMRSYARASGEGYLDLGCGKIVREATVEDLHEERRIREQTDEKLRRCIELVRTRNLPMKLVECEHIFGGERIIFFFMSESRIDFRDLVKDLAQEYHTRIEMRQIGARDEARLVADYETCGQECCCKTFLKTLKPISMKMAKLQKATLDPSKVSGRCGRLKCCLRYEHENYEVLDKKLPKVGQKVLSVHGAGIVVDRQILTQLIQMELPDLKRLAVVVEDVLAVGEVAIREYQDRKQQQTESVPAAEPAVSPRPRPAEPSEAATPEDGTSEADPRRRRRRRRRSRGRKGPEQPDPSAGD